MTILRQRMNNRRMSSNHRVLVGELGKQQTYFVTLGYHVNGTRVTVSECFIKHGKEGQELDNLAADAGILISNILQTGFPIIDILEDMTRLPSYDSVNTLSDTNDTVKEIQPASILGAVLKLIRNEQSLLDEEPV